MVDGKTLDRCNRGMVAFINLLNDILLAERMHYRGDNDVPCDLGLCHFVKPFDCDEDGNEGHSPESG